MPAAIGPSTRNDIIYYVAQGHDQREVAAKLDISRNTVGKYLDRTRAILEEADQPREVVAAMVRDEYDWERRGEDVRLDFLSM